jgi:hypothetical protein
MLSLIFLPDKSNENTANGIGERLTVFNREGKAAAGRIAGKYCGIGLPATVPWALQLVYSVNTVTPAGKGKP